MQKPPHGLEAQNTDLISLSAKSSVFTSHETEYFNRKIEEIGYVNFDSYRVYCGPLAAFFYFDNVPVKLITRERTRTTKRQVEGTNEWLLDHEVISVAVEVASTVKGQDYLPQYKNGYEEGKAWFRNTYALSPDTLYGPHASVYMQDLHDLYFHKTFDALEGVERQKKFMPLIIHPEAFHKRGYYAGIIAEIEQLAETYTILFRDFFKCPHTKTNGTVDTPSDNEEENNIQLVEFFTSVSQYKQVMEILVVKKYCHPVTYVWVDMESGYKDLIAAILKDLHRKGYYKHNVALSTAQIVQVALNTFGVTLSHETVKRKKPECPFIPVAATLT